MKHLTIGIDVGKSTLHISYPAPDTSVREWPVQIITYQDNPNWHQTLIDLIAPGAIVAFEPTGWHLVAPLVSVISQLTSAEIWLVGHGTTGRVRDVHISTAKTDEFDARALALAATWIADGNPPANCHRHNLPLEREVQRLRTLVNNTSRATKQQTRLTNRLHAFAHAMYPEIDIRFNTWLPLALQGIITPNAIKDYVADMPTDRDRRKTRRIEQLAANLPDIDVPTYAEESIQTTVHEIDEIARRLLQLRQQINFLCTREPFAETTRRLLTIPGAGGDPTRIAPFHVACHGLLDQMTPDQVKSSVGISAKTDTSGSIDRTRAQKGGYKPAQAQLYLWTMRLLSATTPPNPVQQYFERIKANGKKKPFRAARAKLATIISGVARSPEGYKYPTQSILPLEEAQPMLVSELLIMEADRLLGEDHDELH
jgi:hypothetical protein